jgi:predicted nucleotidyltransferase component of viral defense system
MSNQEFNRHQLILKQVLTQLFQNKKLLPSLAFKGGTCLYLFYNLPRFSIDLDFDWLDSELPVIAVEEILRRNFKTLEFSDKKWTWFWVGSYEENALKIKLEVNKRKFLASQYELHDFYGVKVRTMQKDCLFAHKLCAITDRKQLKNRDLYDIWWMFGQRFEINEQVIKERMGMDKRAYLEVIAKLLQDGISQNKWRGGKILDGLGQLLKNDQERQWMKEHLLEELLTMLHLHISG